MAGEDGEKEPGPSSGFRYPLGAWLYCVECEATPADRGPIAGEAEKSVSRRLRLETQTTQLAEPTSGVTSPIQIGVSSTNCSIVFTIEAVNPAADGESSFDLGTGYPLTTGEELCAINNDATHLSAAVFAAVRQ